jgi:regulator of replication initiation timing
MAKAAGRTTELEPIDRLEEKLKQLVALVDRLKAEQKEAQTENQRLKREIETLTAKLASTDAAATELSSLKEERDLIRARVVDMLEQLDTLNL